MSTYSDDLALALQLADAADLISMSRYQSQDLVVTTKPDNTPVTDADKATETAIRELIATHRPDDGLIGEEFGEESADKKRHWIIDPIDRSPDFGESPRAVPFLKIHMLLMKTTSRNKSHGASGIPVIDER